MYLINHVNVETLTTRLMIPLEMHSPAAEVSPQL